MIDLGDMAHPCSCSFCAPRPDTAGAGSDALAKLRQKWANERPAWAVQQEDTLLVARPVARRSWRFWRRTAHAMQEAS